MAKTKVVVGIDIGSSRIAALIGQYNEEENKISVVGVCSSLSSGVRKGQIVDIEEVASSVMGSVESSERMAGYGIDRAFVTIGGGHIECRNSSGVVAVADPSGEISETDIERVIDAARAVSLPESREILHVVPREYRVDGETVVKDPKGMTGVRLEVETHLITGSSTAVKNIHKCLSEIGVATEEIVFSGLASSYSALSPTEKELGVILLDIGGGTTSIVAFIEGSITYSSVLPIGGKNVTNDIAAGLRISLDSAEKLKKLVSKRSKKTDDEEEIDLSILEEEGVGKSVSKKTLVDGIIKPRLNEVFTMVGSELSGSGVLGKTPSGIVITGGGALCVGATESARRMLSLPVRLGIPKGVSGLIDEISDPSYAASTGLLLYGTKEGSGSRLAWPGGDIFSKFEKVPVRGLISRITELSKKILP